MFYVKKKFLEIKSIKKFWEGETNKTFIYHNNTTGSRCRIIL